MLFVTHACNIYPFSVRKFFFKINSIILYIFLTVLKPIHDIVTYIVI